jgi:DNA-directed RNA polymerase specialized sigma24 family protein
VLYTPRDHTERHAARGAQETTSTATVLPRPRADDGPLRAAFRDLHGPRLHGFALLVTLGDHQQAARIATTALSEGAGRASTLRHPERAAAWLRARVLRLAARRLPRRAPGDNDRRAALSELGVNAACGVALGALSSIERAALVAVDTEGLAPLDLEVVLGRGASASRRILARARRRYVEGFLAARGTAGESELRGPIAERVHEAAQVALMGGSAPHG